MASRLGSNLDGVTSVDGKLKLRTTNKHPRFFFPSNILEDRDAPQNSFVSISLADSRFIGNARFLFLFSAIQDF
jgi:hypothetical protein